MIRTEKTAFLLIMILGLLIRIRLFGIHEAVDSGHLKGVRTQLRENPSLVSSKDKFNQTFLSKKEPPPDWQILNPPIQDDLHDVFFLDDETGWLMTYGTGKILKTIDGGKNWEITAKLEPLYYEHIQFLDACNGWICGEQGKALKTEDGGKTWLDRSVSFPASTVLLYSQWFFSPDLGAVAGTIRNQDGHNRFCLLKTQNGGRTWAMTDNNPQVHLTQIRFIDTRQGYACGGNQIYKTTDAGESWRLVYTDSNMSGEGFRDVFFIDECVGFASTASGEVVSTRDGGKRWKVNKITNNRLRSVIFVNDSDGYITGDRNREDGVLYETGDGGNTWRVVHSDFPDLHRIKKSSGYIWAVGKKGTVIRKKLG